MLSALITTVPFAQRNHLPIELLKGLEVDFLINPLNKKLKEEELAEMVHDIDIIIARKSDRVNIIGISLNML